MLSDPVYDPASDEPAGLETRTVLCCPILRHHEADSSEAGRHDKGGGGHLSDAEQEREERGGRRRAPHRVSGETKAYACVAVLQLVNKRCAREVATICWDLGEP